MVTPTRRPSLAVLCAAALLAASTLAARQDEQPPAETAAADTETPFIERLAVNIVNVEVFVTDRDGNPVTGLTAEDFEVFEDDRPVEVVNFYRVAEGRPDDAGATTEQPPPAEQPPAATPPPPAEPAAVVTPPSQKLHLIVYVDNFNIHPLNRNRTFSRLREFLANNVRRDDEVMLASYDRSLNIRQPLTSDASAVNMELFELENATGYAAQREAERRDAVRQIYEAQSVNQALRRAAEFSNNAHFELIETLDGLNEMVESLAGLPGRKMLLYVSDGLPLVPGQSLYQAVQQRFADLSALGEAQSRDESRRYMRLIAQANSNRVSFYTIDAGGLRTSSGFGAENPAANTQYVVSTAIDSVHTKNLRDSLLLMADRTGGQAIYNTNDIAQGLERFRQDIGNYYSLGYRAPTARRGRYHRIEVRLRDPERGWQVRHREGYRDKPEEALVTDALTAYLVHDHESNPLGVTLEIGQQASDEEGYVAVQIAVRIPVASIVLLPRGESHEGLLTLYFAAVDERGRRSPQQEMPLQLRIPEESLELARADTVARVIEATMRPGPHKLVVGVRDELSGEQAVVGRRLTLGG